MIKNFKASGAIPTYALVKATATDGVVSQATLSTDLIIGISEENAKADTERVDVTVIGEHFAVAGGVIAFGDRITTDANGKAIKAAPAAGTNANYVGIALISAVVGDTFRVAVIPSTLQG